jgi:Zn-finger in Ran binding protein and others
MPDPTGRWIAARKWQCPACGTVNPEDRERCEGCGASQRPSFDEPVRPLDPLDVVGQRRKAASDSADEPA